MSRNDGIGLDANGLRFSAACSTKGRIIDLSYTAAKILKMIRQGVVKVTIEEID